MSIDVRGYRAADLPGLSLVCLQTALHGQDGTGAYADPRLPGLVYAEPYARFEPGLVFVAEDLDGVCGYVLGTADTERFGRQCEAGWWPPLRERHPLLPSNDTGADAALRRQLHAVPAPTPPFLVDHPAHLHIDLLPRAQRTGTGSRLMATFLGALQQRGVHGVRLGVSAHNLAAQAFYTHCGFTTLQTAAWGRWMGRALTAL